MTADITGREAAALGAALAPLVYPETAAEIAAALLALGWRPATPPADTAPCCMCCKPVDTREIGEGLIVDPNGCELSDGRWTCSSECWERATEPAPSDAISAAEARGYARGVEAAVKVAETLPIAIGQTETALRIAAAIRALSSTPAQEADRHG